LYHDSFPGVEEIIKYCIFPYQIRKFGNMFLSYVKLQEDFEMWSCWYIIL